MAPVMDKRSILAGLTRVRDQGRGMMAKDRMAFAFARLRPALIRYAASIIGDPDQAEDIVHDCWLRSSRAMIGDDIHHPAAFLFRVVRNLALDGKRRQQRDNRHYVTANVDDFAGVAADQASPEQQAFARDDLKKLQMVFATLDERTRTALTMHRLEGARLQDIADHLGVSVTTAHTLVADGLRRCRKGLHRS